MLYGRWSVKGYIIHIWNYIVTYPSCSCFMICEQWTVLMKTFRTLSVISLACQLCPFTITTITIAVTRKGRGSHTRLISHMSMCGMHCLITILRHIHGVLAYHHQGNSRQFSMYWQPCIGGLQELREMIKLHLIEEQLTMP